MEKLNRRQRKRLKCSGLSLNLSPFINYVCIYVVSVYVHKTLRYNIINTYVSYTLNKIIRGRVAPDRTQPVPFLHFLRIKYNGPWEVGGVARFAATGPIKYKNMYYNAYVILKLMVWMVCRKKTTLVSQETIGKQNLRWKYATCITDNISAMVYLQYVQCAAPTPHIAANVGNATCSRRTRSSLRAMTGRSAGLRYVPFVGPFCCWGGGGGGMPPATLLYGWFELHSTVYTLSTLLSFSKNGIRSSSSESFMSSNHDATGTWNNNERSVGQLRNFEGWEEEGDTRTALSGWKM